MVKRKLTGLFVFMVLIASFTRISFGQIAGGDFSSEPVITAQAQPENGVILLHFSLDSNYHITDLKNGFFTIELTANDYIKIKQVVFPEGVPFEEEKVFKGNFTVPVYLEPVKEVTAPVAVKFKVSYQICQEKPNAACFPPTEKELEVTLEKAVAPGQPAAGASIPQTAAAAPTPESGAQSSGAEEISFLDEMILRFEEELKKESFLLFLFVFILGFLTSLTGCIYPMIPIIMGYIGARTGGSKLKGLYLSLFFVLGLAVVYSVLGVIAASTGSMLGAALQEPVVIIIISAIFIAMGLSLAGFFEIPVPSSLSSKVSSGKTSGIAGALIFGGVAGIMAAPCAGPVLVALLTYIAKSQKILFGFFLTFTYALGMGLIFLIVGTFTGVVSAMPKGGDWMNKVKYFFALLLMGGGLYFLGSVAPAWLSTVLWGAFLTGAAVFMGVLKPQEEDAENKTKLFKTLLILMLIIGAILIFNGVNSRFFDSGVHTGAATEEIPWLHNLQDGQQRSMTENKPMMIDTYAEWCEACKKLDKTTYSDPEVIQLLKTRFISVKLDFTNNSDAVKQLQKKLDVRANPTIIFFNPDGTEKSRFFGYKNKTEFLHFVSQLK